MENKSLNIFNESLILASPDTATDDNYEFIESVIIQNIMEIYKPIKAKDYPPFLLQNGGESISVDSKHSLLEAVLEMAKKRYLYPAL